MPLFPQPLSSEDSVEKLVSADAGFFHASGQGESWVRYSRDPLPELTLGCKADEDDWGFVLLTVPGTTTGTW